MVMARLVQKGDWQMTYANAVVSGIFGMLRGALPLTMADEYN